MGEWGARADARAIMRRMDDLIASLESYPDPQVRAGVLELLQGIDALHRQGLTRLVERLREAGGDAALAGAQADPLVRLLLGLYDLAELELPAEPEPHRGPDGQSASPLAGAPQGPRSTFVPLASVRRRAAGGSPEAPGRRGRAP